MMTDQIVDQIKDNLERIRGRIDAAARRVGRNPDDVTLIAVSKTVSVENIIPAVNAGIANLGENRVQEAETKIGLITPPESQSLKWHLIGPLQSNKAKRAVELFDLIHSVDSIKLADRLDRIAAETNKVMPVLIQVDLGKESTKSGVDEKDLEALIERIADCSHLRLEGLMTLPPYFENLEDVRPYF